MRLKRIDPFSLSKIFGVFNTVVGLLIGILLSLTSFTGAFAGFSMGRGSGLGALLFGLGPIIVMPFFYGVIGFILGLLGGWIFNLVSGWVGGLEIELE